MLKKALLATILVVVLLAGCSNNQGTSNPSGNTGNSSTGQTNSQTNDGQPSQMVDWISPGKVQVGNFYPGARAEWNLTIHNGGSRIEQKLVTTGENDSVVVIELEDKLYQSDIKYITDVISSLDSETLTAESYDKGSNSVTITGLLDNQKRIVYVDYIGSTPIDFVITVELPDYQSGDWHIPPEYVKEWITVQHRVTLATFETADVLVVLDMPSDATIPYNQWEFRVVTSRDLSGRITTALASRWLIDMRA